MTRPLAVDRVAHEEEKDARASWPAAKRARVRQVDPGSWWSLLRRWRGSDTEVAVVSAAAAGASASIAGAVSGVPIVDSCPPDPIDRVLRRAAAAAARPGAGLEGDAPFSIVVPVLNDADPLDRLLQALTTQLRADDEVIVVDGGSTDDTLARAERYSDRGVRLLHHPGMNIPAARNTGVKAARHSLIAFTDAGCTPCDGWIDALRAAFAEQPPPDLVTGVYRVAAKGPWEDAVAVACYPVVEEAGRAAIFTRWFTRVFGRGFDPTSPTGRSLAVHIDAWQAVEGMAEDLNTAEDVSFGHTVADAGYECVLSRDAEVVWDQRPNLRGTARMYFRYGLGDGRSDDLVLVSRDLIRAVAYSVFPYVFLTGGRATRSVLVALGLLYLGVPLRRAARRPNPIAVGLLIAPALVLKDLSKAAGCIVGLTGRSRKK